MVIVMQNSIENKGIIIFDEPLKVGFIEWIENHVDCDSITTGKYLPNGKIYIVAYATSEEYNDELVKLNGERCSEYPILCGASGKG